MAWIDPEEEARTRGYITDPATERVAVRAIMRGVPLDKIIEQFGALPQGLLVAQREPTPKPLTPTTHYPRSRGAGA